MHNTGKNLQPFAAMEQDTLIDKAAAKGVQMHHTCVI